MLEGHAPGFFAAHGLARPLAEALSALDRLPTTFEPVLSLESAMARLDALYLRAVRGQPVRRFDAEGLVRTIRTLEADDVLLPAWLFAGLAAPVGVDAPVALPMRFPFRFAGAEAHAYHLTHVVLLETGYLARPLEATAHSDVLDELERVVPACLEERRWDVLGEVLFSLQAGGRRVPARALQALRRAQRDDGSVVEDENDASLHGHTTATALLALAFAETPRRRPRSAHVA